MSGTTFHRCLTAIVFAALLPALCAQEDSGHGDNNALFGVVTVPKGKEVAVAYVLEESPAARADVKPGDVLVSIDETRILALADVDRALSELPPGLEIRVKLRREGRPLTVTATLANRLHYPGPFLRREDRGRTGFVAPAWYAYGWANLPTGATPPTLESTKGKVVVIHAFQSFCPWCHRHGFPGHRALETAFPGAKGVVFFHLQTAWEALDRNTPEAGAAAARKFGITAPVAYDAHVDGALESTFMHRYGTGGTPWTVVIDKEGFVRASLQTPADVQPLKALIGELLRE